MTINNIIDFSKYKSIICLNGKLPEPEFFEKSEIQLIAADGAANRLDEVGIVPDLIIGDLDSVKPELLNKTQFIKVLNQDYSDFQKALGYIRQQKLLPSIICGISGGFLDHILNNISIFMDDSNNIFLDNEMIGMVLSGRKDISLPLNSKISIIGMPKCLISSNGLKWELLNYTLNFPGNNSCFNRTINSKISFNILKGKALLIIYTKNIIDAGIE